MSDIEFQHYPIDVDGIPKTWCVTSIAALGADVQSGFPTGSHNREGRGIPHIRPMNIDRNGNIDLNDVKFVSSATSVLRLQEGDVLFNNTNSPELIGKTSAITHCDEWGFSNHMTRLRFPRESLEYHFAAYQLHFLWIARYFRHRCVNHVNQASISAKPLAQTVPFLVAPLNEQRRIVAKIEELFSDLEAGVAALERAKANLKRYRAAVLKAAVEGKLIEESERGSFSIANWIEIGALLTCVEQGWSPKCEREPSSNENEWAVMKTSAVLPMQFIAHENKRLPISLAPETQFEVKSGDLLITRAGPRNRAAVTCLVRSSRPRLIVCDKIYRIRCDYSRVIPAYLEAILNSPPLLHELDEMKTGISDSGVNLTQQKFRRLKIPVPPLQIQEKIVNNIEERFSVATVAESEINNSLLRAARLRQSILKQAFEGKLVPQDPSDEPASVLLERPRASQSDNDIKNKAKNNISRAKRKKSERMVDK